MHQSHRNFPLTDPTRGVLGPCTSRLPALPGALHFPARKSRTRPICLRFAYNTHPHTPAPPGTGERAGQEHVGR